MGVQFKILYPLKLSFSHEEDNDSLSWKNRVQKRVSAPSPPARGQALTQMRRNARLKSIGPKSSNMNFCHRATFSCICVKAELTFEAYTL